MLKDLCTLLDKKISTINEILPNALAYVNKKNNVITYTIRKGSMKNVDAEKFKKHLDRYNNLVAFEADLSSQNLGYSIFLYEK